MSLVRQICQLEISSNKNLIDQKLKNPNRSTRYYLQLTIVMKLRKNTNDKDRPSEVQSIMSLKKKSMHVMLVPKAMQMKAKCYK
jgi:hypothetical protein